MRIPVATIVGWRGVGLLFLTCLAVPPHAVAGGAVGDGTPESCTEAALEAALASGGSVTFRCGSAPLKITVTSPKTIAKNTVLDGGGRITLSGGGTTRILSVTKHTALTLRNLSLTDGHGGQDQSDGAVGGAVYIREGKLSATNCTFANNSAENLGGAIFNLLGRVTLTDCSFSNNSAGSGGAVETQSNLRFSITRSTFSNNSGGAIDSFSPGRGKATVDKCTFANNSGGAIKRSGLLAVSNSTFSNNSSGGGGGGIFHSASRGGGRLSVTNCTFVSNSSAGYGGAIDSSGGKASEMLSVTNCTFVSNSSTGSGGAIKRGSGKLAVTNSSFSSNSARSGGAIASVNLTVTNSTFANNSAGAADVGGSGGAIDAGAGVAAVSNSTFFGNSSTANGGAIYSAYQLTVTNCTFSNNSAADDVPGFGPGGAAIHYLFVGGQVELSNTVIANSLSGENCVGLGSGADRGHNIDSGSSCDFDSSKGSFSDTDPKLDPAGLADNGGPTQTIAVLADSPAINGGNSRACSMPPVGGYDQRGWARTGFGSGSCTIGAYEFYP